MEIPSLVVRGESYCVPLTSLVSRSGLNQLPTLDPHGQAVPHS